MKRFGAVILLVLFLSGCSGASEEMNRSLMLREKLQKGSCAFTAKVTADYGDKLHTFTLNCAGDAQGDLAFTVEAPESIAGITGRITGTGGALTFEDTALYFELLADGQLSPVSAPWVLMKALRGGYLTSAGMENDQLRVSVNDSYEEDALNLDVWLDSADIPQRADICYAGKRILSLKLENVQIS